METVQELNEVMAVREGTQTAAAPAIITKSRSRYGFAAQADAFESARWFWMALLMTAQSCLGAVACLFIQHMGGDFIPLGVCAAITMASNAMFIGLASGRLCLATLYISVAVNASFILAGVI